MDVLAESHLWMVYEQVKADPEAYRVRRSCPSLLLHWGGQALKSGLVGAMALVLVLGSLATTASAWNTTAVISTPPGYALNARWGPGTSYGVYTKLLRGTTIQLTGNYRNGWAQLTNDTWVAGNFITITNRNSGWNNGVGGDRGYAYVRTPSGGSLNARWGPGTSYGIHRTIPQGSLVELSGRTQNGWAQLMDTTWVYGRYLSQWTGSGGGTPNNGSNQNGSNQTDTGLTTQQIIQVQTDLKQLGYLPATYVASGVYDNTTANAVRTFQRVNGLPETGRVDSYTWTALYNSAQAASTPTPAPTTAPTPAPTTTPTPVPTLTPNPTTPPTSAPNNGTQQQMRVSTGGDTALVFSGPGSEYDLVGNLADGTVVTTTGRTANTWTELASGGWIFSMWLAPL